MGDIDCQPLDYFTWSGFLGDAWIIIPFLLGMFAYKLFNGVSFPLKHDKLLSAKDADDLLSDQDSETERKPATAPATFSKDSERYL